MSSFTTERYSPVQCPANTATPFTGNATGGFLCTTAGVITINRYNGTSVIPALSVSAGVYYPLPFYIGQEGGTITTSSGAVGVLGVV